MNQDEHKIVVRRMAGLIAVASVLIAVYVLRLIFLQLVNSDSFKAQATNTTDYNFTVTAARGDIVDSAGRRIAASTTSYNVVLSKLLMGDEDLDAMLQRIVELLEAHGEKWNDSLLIGEPDAAGHYSFTAQADSTSDQKALAAMKDSLGLQQYATADDVMEKLVEDYKLESYPLHWQRVLGGIHYEMQQQAFSNVNNFVMAENVSEVTVATIKENSLTMPGVEIVETSTRSYDEGDIIPHVLGRVGKITAEKWKVTDENGQTTYPLREKGYNMNDMIGVSGLEAVYEDELRGKDGVETITRSSDGVIVGTAMTTAVCWPPPTTPATTRTSSPPSTASTARTRACPCSTARCRACTPPAPPSSLRWRWRRWIPASSTAFPPSTATVSIPIMTTTAPSVPATATAATSMSSQPSSGAATSSSTMWAAAPPVTSTMPTPTIWALVPAPAWRSMRPPAA